MKSIPPALLARMRADTASIAVCFWIEKKDGTFIRGTTHDQDITLTNDSAPDDDAVGTYLAIENISMADIQSGADMAVDNTEVDGALTPADSAVGITVADIEAGLFDDAPVEILVCDWSAPEDGYYVARRGFLGEIKRDTDGKYTTEIRSLKQLLAQVTVRTYSERCQVKRFGDAECKFNVASVTVTGTVTSVTNRKRFDADIAADSGTAAGYFNGGELTFTSGANDGYMREVKQDAVGDVAGALSFWEAFPNDVQVGDTFSLSPGCNRLLSTCRDVFDNIVNFRGYGVFIPGIDALAKGPT